MTCFVEAPCAVLVGEDLRWRRGHGRSLEMSGLVGYPECLRLLEPLETPWTTELFIDCGQWTAYLNNDRNGGDPTAAAAHLANRLDVRCVVAMHDPLFGPRHGGTQFWLHGPDGVPPLMYQRAIWAVCEDGRWKFDTDGEIQPFEKIDRYQERLIKKRFDRSLLVEYLAALGIDVDSPDFFDQGRSVRQHVPWATTKETRVDARARLQLL